MTPAMWAGTVYEIALVIWGACLLWPLGLSPAARSAPRRLTAWNIQPIDFACYLCFAFVGATTLSGDQAEGKASLVPAKAWSATGRRQLRRSSIEPRMSSHISM